jgi:hypothetical protein
MGKTIHRRFAGVYRFNQTPRTVSEFHEIFFRFFEIEAFLERGFLTLLRVAFPETVVQAVVPAPSSVFFGSVESKDFDMLGEVFTYFPGALQIAFRPQLIVELGEVFAQLGPKTVAPAPRAICFDGAETKVLQMTFHPVVEERIGL